MTENVNYRRCVCDRCGKEERISQTTGLPKYWEHMGKLLGGGGWDFCEDCCDAVNEMIQNDIERHREKTAE